MINNTFNSILDNHEREDLKVANSKEKIIETIKIEFANSNELIAKAQEMLSTGANFFDVKNGVIDFPIVPIRKDCGYHIRKHTMCQMPYYHRHDFYELIYVQRGVCKQIINGKEVIMQAKELCILEPSVVHAILPSDKKDIVLKLVIPKDKYLLIGEPICKSKKDGILYYQNISENIEYFMFKILNESYKEDEYFDKIITSYLTLLFAELSRDNKIDIAFNEVINKYFEKNYKYATLNDFADKLGYNTTYASRKIKEKTGKNFSELLAIFRLQLASKMLSETDKRIEEIAYELGYLNTSGFYKQFNSFYGMKPAEYRKMF